MGVQKEDVEKFLNGNPAFAKQYFTKKVDSAALSKISGLPQKQIDFGHFQDLSQVNMRFGKERTDQNLILIKICRKYSSNSAKLALKGCKYGGLAR